MMHLKALLERQRRKLNELGEQSLAAGIPLRENKPVQAQSRKVDELIVRMQKKEEARRERKKR